MAQVLNLLYCYAPEDQPWLETIEAHLQELKHHCQIISRFDGELVPNPIHKAHLLALFDKVKVDIVLLLISPHFQTVETFWAELNRESKIARWSGKCWVVALVLEPVAWNHAPAEAIEILPREEIPPRAEQEQRPYAPLKVFPDDIKPLAMWPSQEQAFKQIESWLLVTIEQLWLAQGDYHRDEGMTTMAHKALAAYEEALRLNPLLKEAWRGKAVSLLYRRYHEEAREKAARRKKNAPSDKDDTPIGPKLYEDALLASEEALRLDPAYLLAWLTKANALVGLKRYEEALHTYDEALRIDSTHGKIWFEKSRTLKAMGHNSEADQALKIARQLGWLV